MTLHSRLLSLLAVAALAFAITALAACGGDDGNGGGSDTPETPPQQVVDAGDAAAGQEVFAQNCAACHGDDGGGGSGPALAGVEAYTDPEVTVSQIREGGGGMPAFGDRLSEQELSDVSAYVVKDLAAK